MPFLWEPLPPSTSSFSQAGSGIHAAASFHSPLRVVRISRRSGNFDSTACRSGLQVTLVSSLFRSRAGNPVCQPVPVLPKLCPARTLPGSRRNHSASTPCPSNPFALCTGCAKRRPFRSGALRLPCWSLASQLLGRWFVHRTYAGFPGRSLPQLGPLVGGCSCRLPVFKRAGLD